MDRRTKPLLTVAVLSRDRPEKLKATLRKFVGCIETHRLGSGVDVYVSDNSSASGSGGAAKGGRLEGVRRVKTGGGLSYAENFVAAARRARGSYVWIVSDDDYYNEHLLAVLYRLVKDEPTFEVLCINSSHTEESRGGAPRVTKRNLMEVSADQREAVFSASVPEVVRAESFSAFGLLPAYVFRREALLAALESLPERERSNSYIQQYVGLGIAAGAGMRVIGSDQYLSWRCEGSHWATKNAAAAYAAHFVDLMSILEMLRPSLGAVEVSRIGRQVFKNAFFAILGVMESKERVDAVRREVLSTAWRLGIVEPARLTVVASYPWLGAIWRRLLLSAVSRAAAI